QFSYIFGSPKSLTRAFEKKNHLTVHTGEKSHKSDICMRNFFSWEWIIKTHFRLLAGECLNECICHKKFLRIDLDAEWRNLLRSKNGQIT
ncbi:UNVERIFIED_CONTAM: Zbtb24, partial [Trichonephila clavipes]